MTTQNAPPEIKSVADAVNAGIAAAAAGTPPNVPEVTDDGTTITEDADGTTDTTGGDGAGDAPAGDAGVDTGTETGDDAGTDEPGTDPADGAAGTDDAAGDGAAGDGKDPAAAAPKPDAKPAAKAKDPLTDPIPNALKPETKERIRTLVERTKTAEASLATVTTERDELINAVIDTGASPEQYSGMLDYLALVCSNDRNKQIAAANFLMKELSALSRIGGFRIPGITTISGHKDLEQQVAEGKLSLELAEEIAASRSATAHQGKVGAAAQRAQQARQEYQRADAKAREDMNTLEEGFRASDPLYASKQPIILGMLQTMIRGDRKNGVPPLHPSKWPAAFQHIYKTLPAGAVARPQPRPAARAPANQPLRTQQPAGGQTPEPKSMAEALDLGIKLANGQ